MDRGSLRGRSSRQAGWKRGIADRFAEINGCRELQLQIADHLGQLHGTDDNCDVVALLARMQHASDNATRRKQNPAWLQILCMRGIAVDDPLDSVRREANDRI